MVDARPELHGPAPRLIDGSGRRGDVAAERHVHDETTHRVRLHRPEVLVDGRPHERTDAHRKPARVEGALHVEDPGSRIERRAGHCRDCVRRRERCRRRAPREHEGTSGEERDELRAETAGHETSPNVKTESADDDTGGFLVWTIA